MFLDVGGKLLLLQEEIHSHKVLWSGLFRIFSEVDAVHKLFNRLL